MKKEKQNDKYSDLAKDFLEEFKDSLWNQVDVQHYELYNELNLKTFLAYVQLVTGLHFDYYDSQFCVFKGKYILNTELLAWMTEHDIFQQDDYDEDSLDSDIESYFNGNKKDPHTA